MHVVEWNEEIRPVNEAKMRARWKLGRALAKVERRQGRGKKTDLTSGPEDPKSTFTKYIKALGLKSKSAKMAQRLGTLPEDELEAALAQAPENDSHDNETPTFSVGPVSICACQCAGAAECPVLDVKPT